MHTLLQSIENLFSHNSSFISATFRLNGVPNEVIQGDTVNINLTCSVDSANNGTYVEWVRVRGNKSESLSTIYGIYTNKRCIIDERNSSYIYECYPSSRQYNLIIPAALLIDGIQNDCWVCRPFFGGASNFFNLTFLGKIKCL